MHIDITTEHEATQTRLIKQPLGLDYQGRHPEAAHAATAEGADDDQISDFGAFNAAPFILKLCAGFFALYCIAMTTLPWVLALAQTIKGWVW